MNEGIIKTVSLYGVLAVFLYVGKDLYDKTPTFSIILLMFGLILLIYVTYTEMVIKTEIHDKYMGRYDERGNKRKK